MNPCASQFLLHWQGPEFIRLINAKPSHLKADFQDF
jgi:hypothetical protein